MCNKLEKWYVIWYYNINRKVIIWKINFGNKKIFLLITCSVNNSDGEWLYWHWKLLFHKIFLLKNFIDMCQCKIDWFDSNHRLLSKIWISFFCMDLTTPLGKVLGYNKIMDVFRWSMLTFIILFRSSILWFSNQARWAHVYESALAY